MNRLSRKTPSWYCPSMRTVRGFLVVACLGTFGVASACSDDETGKPSGNDDGGAGESNGGSAGSGGSTPKGGSSGDSGAAGDTPGGAGQGAQGGDAGAGRGGDAGAGQGGEPQGGLGGESQGGTAGGGGAGGVDECDDAPEEVSVSSLGVAADASSSVPSLSADGRFVAFVSVARNLVTPTDTNDLSDIFVRDRQTETTERVSVSSAGVVSNSVSLYPSVSADGRFVAFESRATNLAAADADAYGDVYIHDRQTHETILASLGSRTPLLDGPDAVQPTISDDGSRVAFLGSNLTNDAVYATNVYVYDRVAQTTTLASVTQANVPSNENCTDPVLSSDGRLVAFSSQSAGFLPAPPLLAPQIFMKNLTSGALTLVSQNAAGERGNDTSIMPSISANGRYVAFVSAASNLVTGDANGLPDIFVRDLQTSTTTRVSVDSSGAEASASGADFPPSISDDGRYVAFASDAANLVTGDTGSFQDAFVHDRMTGTTRRISVNGSGTQGNNSTSVAVVSADGQTLGFHSLASNLVPNDNGWSSVFVVMNCAP